MNPRITYATLQVPAPSNPNRKYPKFSTKWSETLNLLRTEGSHHHTGVMVIELDIAAHQINQDGSLRSNASGFGTAVAVSFTSRFLKDGKWVELPIRFACDRFTSGNGHPAWQQNVRAIALSMEALRTIDRYGVGQGNEQFMGFAQIPQGEQAMQRNEAEALLGLLETRYYDADMVKDNYKAFARQYHPDVGGNDYTMAKLVEARDVLLSLTKR